MGGVKIIWGSNIYYYNFIISETANTQKSEVFLLRISSGNVNASVFVTCYSNLFKNSLRKTSLFVLFELLPARFA